MLLSVGILVRKSEFDGIVTDEMFDQAEAEMMALAVQRSTHFHKISMVQVITEGIFTCGDVAFNLTGSDAVLLRFEAESCPAAGNLLMNPN